MSTTPHTPAMRMKSHWFRPGAGRSAAEQASAMAFIVWRVAQQTLKRMRGAGFDIEAGPPYFAFMREVLVFLVALADRIAHARLAPEARGEFTAALVRHLARTLQDNEQDLLGAPAAGQPPHGDSFIDLVNEVSGALRRVRRRPEARRSADAGFEPDFAFVRYLGSRLEPTLPEKDRRWVHRPGDGGRGAGSGRRSCSARCATCFDPAPRAARRSAVSGD